jgi:hypothetical protein
VELSARDEGDEVGVYLSGVIGANEEPYPFDGSRADAERGDAVQAWACEESHARYGESGWGDG